MDNRKKLLVKKKKAIANNRILSYLKQVNRIAQLAISGITIPGQWPCIHATSGTPTTVNSTLHIKPETL